MIMPRSDGGQLLMPVNPVFIWFTLIVALAVNIVPLGRAPAMPDLLAVVLVFWNVHQSRRIGVGTAFGFGLLMDVHSGAMLGQHALAYSLLAFLAVWLSRRILWFGPGLQALHIALMLLVAEGATVLVRLAAGDQLPGWPTLVGPLAGAALWPVVSWLLLMPQRRMEREQTI